MTEREGERSLQDSPGALVGGGANATSGRETARVPFW